MTTTTTPRITDEEVRPFLGRYSALRDEGVHYNEDFKGRIPGLEDHPDEDRAIYLLSGLWKIAREQQQIGEAIADGFKTVESGPPGGITRGDVIVYRAGHYCGGAGMISHYESARLFFERDGKPYAVVPKGKQHGHDTAGALVLVRKA